MEHFKSDILIMPGLGNSGDQHWQSLWQSRFGFARIEQAEWEYPVCAEWVATVQRFIEKRHLSSVILVGHSLACSTIVRWAASTGIKIRGALLVAPSDTEAPSYPAGTTGFKPMPLSPLNFPSITIASNNDPYVTIERATFFSHHWNSELINIGDAGHINVASGHGPWSEGLEFLRRLDTK